MSIGTFLIIEKTITVVKQLISHTQLIHISRIFLVLGNKLFPNTTRLNKKEKETG